MPSWAGFQSRRGSYGSLNSRTPSDGSVYLNVATADDSARARPIPAQLRAFQFLLDNERIVARSVLQSIFCEYPSLRKAYGYSEQETEEFMPHIEWPEEFRSLIGLSHVHVLTVEKDGITYLGFEFGCTWDTEHGLGVMTHCDRVVQVGGADKSFLNWIAERDAEANR